MWHEDLEEVLTGSYRELALPSIAIVWSQHSDAVFVHELPGTGGVSTYLLKQVTPISP